MPIARLKEFLEKNNVKYVTISHSQAFTAQEIAASAHIPGRELAKTVMLKVDDEMAMAVLPAPYRVDRQRLQEAIGAESVELASEKEFRDIFPSSEVGAMPPFGNLWDMPVYVDRRLRDDDKIAFNAGSHTELVQLAYEDFERLVKPQVLELGVHEEAA